MALFLMAAVAAAPPPAVRARVSGCAAGLSGGTAPPAFAAADSDSLIKLFDYDRDVPLDVRELKSEELEGTGVVLRHVTYANPVEGRVTATLVELAGAGSRREGAGDGLRAGVIFMHWGQGDRTEFVWEAGLLARAGAVSILLDAPWARPEPWKRAGESLADPEASREMYMQNIVDLRRAVDLLLERGDVDPQRIAYVGHSFGATWGGVLCAVEKRIRTFVLIGGLPSLTDFSLKGAQKFDEYVRMLQSRLPKEKLDKYVEMISPLSPVRFVPHSAPSSVFMQFAIYDSWISERAARIYFEAAGEPKKVKWYPTSHEFNHLGALLDRARWLEREIGIGPVEPLLSGILEGR